MEAASRPPTRPWRPRRPRWSKRYGLQAELPTLDSVEALGAYLAAVAARVESRQLSPAQGNTLVAVVKQSAALLGLSLDIKLAEQLDAMERK